MQSNNQDEFNTENLLAIEKGSKNLSTFLLEESDNYGNYLQVFDKQPINQLIQFNIGNTSHDQEVQELQFCSSNENITQKVDNLHKRDNLNKQQIIEQIMNTLLIQKQPQYFNNLNQKQTKFYLSDVLSKKTIFKNKKNTNFPKYLIRLMIAHFEQYQDQFQTLEEKEQFYSIQNILVKYRKQKKRYFTVRNINQLLGGEKKIKARKIVASLLRSKYKSSIIMSQYMQNKVNNLITAKVFSLRCRSPFLIGRIQSK